MPKITHSNIENISTKSHIIGQLKACIKQIESGPETDLKHALAMVIMTTEAYNNPQNNNEVLLVAAINNIKAINEALRAIAEDINNN